MLRAFEAEKVAVPKPGGVRRFFYFNRCESGKERKNDADEQKAAAGVVSYPPSQTARTEGKNRKNRPET